MRLVLFSLTCLFLLGCGGSAESPEAAAAPPPLRPKPRPAVDSRPVIVAFGDSLSEGLGAPPGQSYPDFLQKELDSSGYKYRVANLGISGDTTTGGLNRIQSVIDLEPELVILELGGNDGLRGVPVASTRANLDRMIALLKEAKIRVLLAGMSLPPNYGALYIRDFERMYSDLARKHEVTLIPFLLADIAKRLKQQPNLLQRDGIHPTPEGNRLVAETVMRSLEPMLRPARAERRL